MSVVLSWTPGASTRALLVSSAYGLARVADTPA